MMVWSDMYERSEEDDIVKKYSEYPTLGKRIANGLHGLHRNVNPRISYNETVKRVNWYAENYPKLFPGFLEHVR